MFNAPLSPGADGAAFRAAWSGTLLPAIEAFAPGLLVISAGFDAHARDPLAQLRVREPDFAWLTAELLRHRRAALPAATSVACWRAATTSRRWRAAPRRMSGC